MATPDPGANTVIAATFNANSIRTRLDTILAWLAAYKPDVLGIQETKVQDKDFPLAPLQAAGYHVSFRGEKAHAGVALLTRSEPSAVAYGLDDGEEPADPARLVYAFVNGLHVVNCYVPQGREITDPMYAYKLRWLARLRAYFTRHFTTRDKVLWMGDLNVAPEPADIYNSERQADHVAFHVEARRALSSVRDWGFIDVYRKHHPEPGRYTYFDYRLGDALEANKGWRVDHLFATPPLASRSTDAWIDLAPRRAEQPSDHTFLAASFRL
jgi:exodeoxyribonuclease-3